jgi:hypothetical protein
VIASDWGISLTTLEGHLIQETVHMPGSKPKHDYPALIEEYDQRLANGESAQAIKATFESRGIHVRTFLNQRSQIKKVHQRTPEHTERLPEEQYTQKHLGTLPDADPTEVHPGTLEGHQEVMEDIYQSVPDVPHISTDEVHQGTSEHPSTPEVHPEVSPDDSSMAHSGVPARQDPLISTPMVHPDTPSEEDWELWTTIKAMWPRVEKMLSDQQVLLGIPLGTPRQTQKKTYVFDVQHIALIDEYARVHRLDLKDVIYTMCNEFFERRQSLPADAQ